MPAQLDGREDKMYRGTAAVCLHGISAFKHKKNTIKLPWWAICYFKQRRLPISESVFKRTIERKRKISPSPVSSPLSLSAPAACVSFFFGWCMSDLQWWICRLLPSGSLTASMIHMTSLPLTLLGTAQHGWQPRAEGHRARPDKGFSKWAWTTMIALLPSISSPLLSSPPRLSM